MQSSAYNITEPWLPFKTRTDFEFAEMAHEAFLTEDVTERLIKLMHSVASTDNNTLADNKNKFTIKNYKDLTETWNKASNLLTPVIIFDISLII